MLRDILNYDSVSRETIDDVFDYIDLLKAWNIRVALISKLDMDFMLDEHIADSYHLAKVVSGYSKILDLGSGNGLPGVIIALINRDKSVVLTDKNFKKSVFLREVKRKLNLDLMEVDSISVTSDVLNVHKPDVIVAKAFASVDRILDICGDYCFQGNIDLILSKSMSWSEEIKLVEKKWYFNLQIISNPYINRFVLVKMSNIKRNEEVS